MKTNWLYRFLALPILIGLLAVSATPALADDDDDCDSDGCPTPAWVYTLFKDADDEEDDDDEGTPAWVYTLYK